jgi:hypothetical protein
MSEDEWLACGDPLVMGREIPSGAGFVGRKSMLFGCSCCRLIWDHLSHAVSREAVAVAERFADGAAGESEMLAAGRAARAVPDVLFDRGALSVVHLCDRRGAAVARTASRAAGFGRPSAEELGARNARMIRFLRDIFGNPFRPVAFSPAWRTDTAVTLARQMYESRDFSAMPILADALQDAGCDNEDILSHCRGDGPHVRGCWVVDLVLGKE